MGSVQLEIMKNMMAVRELPASKPARKKGDVGAQGNAGGGCASDNVCCIAGAAKLSTLGERSGCHLTGVC